MKGKKKTKVEKHRGNPHGNQPSMPGTHGHDHSDEQLRQNAEPGVSKSPRRKQ